MEPSETPGVRIALAAIAGCVASSGLYALLRVAQALLLTEPDPALIIWSEHAGFFWRTWTAAYAGGMVAFITYVLAGRHAARTARALATSVVVVTLLSAAQGLLLP